MYTILRMSIISPGNLAASVNSKLLSGADLHMEVIRHVYREVNRLNDLSDWKHESSKTSQISVKVCRFVDQCIDEGKITKENKEKALDYNVPFWTQALLKKLDTKLRFDIWDQKAYPENTNKFPVIPLTWSNLLNRAISYLPDSAIWKSILQNYNAVEEEYNALLDEIERKEIKKVVFVGNHATWLNHPLSAYFLTRKRSWRRHIESRFLNTVVAPAILTTELTYIGATLWSNIIKTWADTERGNTVFWKKNRVRAWFAQAMSAIDNQWEAYYLISPSGTTDKQKDNKIIITQPSPGSIQLVDSLIEQGFTPIIIGTNDLEIMKWNASIQQWNAYVKWKICAKWDDIMQELANCVIDNEDSTIGELETL
jgi:hypothetical protein